MIYTVKACTLPWRFYERSRFAPQAIEWEERYILHGIQQGWPLLNIETTLETLVARTKASQLDFLHCSFEDLAQEKFVHKKGIMAFIRQYYRPTGTQE